MDPYAEMNRALACISRSEILSEIDPSWSERWRGDVDMAWNFYYQFAREDIERVKRESAR